MDFTKKFLKNELIEFEKTFSNAVKSHISLLDTIMKYVSHRKGKQLRPIIVLLSSHIAGNTVNDISYRAAALIELLHTATLVHDDVVDDTDQRRGFFSINALWKNKIAVLVGDYLLSKGLLLSLNNNDFTILKILSEAVKNLSEGELLQMEKARKLDITEDVYFEIIKGKTASLISCACAAGAYATNQDENVVSKLKIMGENIGIAFQIKDDLFDYGTDDIGKPTGNDIKEKKMTLPLIYTMNNCDIATKKKIKYIVKNENTNKQKIKEVIDIVLQTGGIKYAEQKMNEYIANAKKILSQFGENDSTFAMNELIDYVINRKK